jgi:hypothetical protein
MWSCLIYEQKFLQNCKMYANKIIQISVYLDYQTFDQKTTLK